jgi:hypothetical protein
VTVDQIAARHLGKETSLPSLELCAEPGGMISFRTPNQPLPMESDPRKLFQRLFGVGDTPEQRKIVAQEATIAQLESTGAKQEATSAQTQRQIEALISASKK